LLVCLRKDVAPCDTASWARDGETGDGRRGAKNEEHEERLVTAHFMCTVCEAQDKRTVPLSCASHMQASIVLNRPHLHPIRILAEFPLNLIYLLFRMHVCLV